MPSKSRRRSTPRTRTQTQKKSRVEKRRRNQSRSRPRSRRSVAQRKKSGSRSRRNLRGGLLSQQQQQEQRTARGKGVSPGDWVAGTAAVLGTGAGLYALQQRRNALKAEEAATRAQTARKEAVKARSFASFKIAALRLLSGKKAEEAKREAREANEKAVAAEQRAEAAEERARSAEIMAAQNAPQQTAQETEFTRRLLALQREDLNAFENCVVQSLTKRVLFTDSEKVFNCLQSVNTQSTIELFNEFQAKSKTFDGHKILRKVVEFDLETAFEAIKRHLEENPIRKLQFLEKWKNYSLKNFFFSAEMITPILNVEVPKAYLAQFELNLQTLKSEVKSEVKKHTKTLQNNLESYIYTLRKNNAVFPQNVLENYLLAQQYVKMLRVLLLTENLNVILNTVVKQETTDALNFFEKCRTVDLIMYTELQTVFKTVFFKIDEHLWFQEFIKLGKTAQDSQVLALVISNLQGTFVPNTVFNVGVPELNLSQNEILSKLPLLQSKEPEDTIYLTSLVSELTSFSTLPLF